MRFLALQNQIVEYALHSRSLLSCTTEKTYLIGTLWISIGVKKELHQVS